MENTERNISSNYSFHLSHKYSMNLTKEHKKTNGQYFTPVEIAHFMSSLVKCADKEKIFVLDPGCGTGILSCSLIENLTTQSSNIKIIYLYAYETDSNIVKKAVSSYLKLKENLFSRGIVLHFKIFENDFVLECSQLLHKSASLFSDFYKYDYIICNPPYFKLQKDDPRVRVTAILNSGQPNIYALFLAISAQLLNTNGQLVYIIPRSFAAGEYFRKFRDYFFNLITIDHVHSFISRDEAFKKDNVLQENIIIKGTKNDLLRNHGKIRVSVSKNQNDLNTPKTFEVPYSDVIDISTTNKYFFIPVSERDITLIEQFKNWNNTLSSFNINISTGPVVSFRAKDYIVNEESNSGDTVPLLWMHNVSKMKIKYPSFHKNHAQLIKNIKKSEYLLIPNKNYVLLRRFSSKEDADRLIAAPFFAKDYDCPKIGVENKLNYIYKKNGFLTEDEANGIAALLNSKIYDDYFRIFSGNTQVSATELRNISFPPLDQIVSIGKMVKDKSLKFKSSNIEHEIEKILEVNGK